MDPEILQPLLTYVLPPAVTGLVGWLGGRMERRTARDKTEVDIAHEVTDKLHERWIEANETIEALQDTIVDLHAELDVLRNYNIVLKGQLTRAGIAFPSDHDIDRGGGNGA